MTGSTVSDSAERAGDADMRAHRRIGAVREPFAVADADRPLPAAIGSTTVTTSPISRATRSLSNGSALGTGFLRYQLRPSATAAGGDDEHRDLNRAGRNRG
jgi:hypothetical protein